MNFHDLHLLVWIAVIGGVVFLLNLHLARKMHFWKGEMWN